jgi:hypothetical protein
MEEIMPGLIGSLLLLISGAIAKYAYSDSVWSWTSGGHSHSLQIDTIGTILLLAGIVALVFSTAWSFMSRKEVEEKAEEVVEDDVPVIKSKSVKIRKTT